MNVRTLIRFVYMVSLLSLTTGCASFFSSPVSRVIIESQPSDAAFSVVNESGDEVARGRTPGVVNLNASSRMYKSARYLVNIDALGYMSESKELKASVSPWYFLNILGSVPGLLGLVIIDPFTGAQFRLPKEASIVLAPISHSSSDSSTVEGDQ